MRYCGPERNSEGGAGGRQSSCRGLGMDRFYPHRRGLKGVQGTKPPAGVWGVPRKSLFFLLAATGGMNRVLNSHPEPGKKKGALPGGNAGYGEYPALW
jgi:hypothetical protein